MIAFVQQFGIGRPGGGPRILRALLQSPPVPVHVYSTGLIAGPPTGLAPEDHLPLRRPFGALERTPVSRLLPTLELVGGREFRARLERTLRQDGAQAVHALAHGVDFWHAMLAARASGIPYHLTVHDDILYTLRGKPTAFLARATIGQAWRSAVTRFVISEELGEEYNRRYGERPFSIVTDGLESVPDAARPTSPNKLRVYFMGLFHSSYAPNMSALLAALNTISREYPEWEISLTCRCGALPLDTSGSHIPVKNLPFASEDAVRQDMAEADLLYMPLPLERSHSAFARFSLSTKMISYLGSGLPILYHGPSDSAAFCLLQRSGAATCVDALDEERVTRALKYAAETRLQVAESALALARRRFLLADQRAMFWSSMGYPVQPAAGGAAAP